MRWIPGNSDGVGPDGELATLQDHLSDYRLTLRMKCEGLDTAQLARGAVAEQRVVDAAYADLAREQAATDAMLADPIQAPQSS
jgi:hypothetical protein